MSETPFNHPTAEELRALSLGQLGEAELARVSAHLARLSRVLPPHRSTGRRRPSAGAAPASAARRDETLVSPAQRRSAVRALRRGQAARAGAGTTIREPSR